MIRSRNQQGESAYDHDTSESGSKKQITRFLLLLLLIWIEDMISFPWLQAVSSILYSGVIIV